MISTKDFLNITLQRDFKLIDNHKYTGSGRHPITCHCGHTWHISYANLKAGHGCPECKKVSHLARIESGKTSRKALTTDDFRERLAEVRDDVTIPKDSVYVKASVKLIAECKHGHRWPVRPAHLMSLSRCPHCYKKEYDNDSVDAKLVGDFGNIRRIGDVVTGEPTTFECLIGNHEFHIKPATLFGRASKVKCPICSSKLPTGFDESFDGVVYFATVVVNDIILYKVGKTNRNPKKRLSGCFKKFHLYKTISCDGKTCSEIEQLINNYMKPYKAFKYGDRSNVDCVSGEQEVFTECPVLHMNNDLEFKKLILNLLLNSPKP